MERKADRFSSRTGFVLATVGSAVGLGSIWKFPYEAGQHGGGTFLLFYAIGLALVVLPLLLAEFVIGRHGRADAAASLQSAALAAGRSPAWRWVGLAGILTGFVILTYYAVIAGMTMAYVPHAALRGFAGIDAAASAAAFAELTGSPVALGLWQAAFLAAAAAVVARGVRAGVEAACTVLMPLLGILMVGLVIYGVVAGDAGRAARFLLGVRLDAVSPGAALEALGLGFFSIGVGMGVMITYAAYAGETFDLRGAALATVLGDTAISLLAGFAIFPIVFAEGLDPAGGATLMFLTLPIAFGALPFGDLLGGCFFLLLFVAALASGISLIEVVVAPLVRRTGWSRARATVTVAATAWVLGLPAMLSFNLWAGVRPLGAGTLFDLSDGLASNLLLPLCGLALSLFAGWRLPRAIYAAELTTARRGGTWLLPVLVVLLRWIVPGVIVAYTAAAHLPRF